MKLRQLRLRLPWIAAALFPVLLLARTLTSAAQSDAWVVDPKRTHIAFAIDAIGYPRTKGEFHRFEGHITVDLEHWERSRVIFHVASNSVDVGSDSFGAYIQSSAFLDAGRFPTIDFASKTVDRIDDHSVRVSGDLTLLGVTKPLTVDVSVQRQTEGGRQRLSFSARTQIDRLEFGMNSGFPLVSRDIDLVISSEAAAL